jgi:hypothetical protein
MLRAFLQCFAHSSPGPLVFWRRNGPVPSTYYSHHNSYRINLDKSLGKIIGVAEPKEASVCVSINAIASFGSCSVPAAPRGNGFSMAALQNKNEGFTFAFQLAPSN